MVTDSLHARAVATVTALVENRFRDVTRDFTDELRAALPPERLEATWQGLTAQVGAFQEIEGYETVRAATGVAVVAQALFERAPLSIVVAFDDGGRIAGLRITPRPRQSDRDAGTPPYADRTKFEERDVTVGEDEWRLPGTLSVPRGTGPFPAALLVHGSGPQDRDQTLGASKPFRDLAWGLASRGIVVLRYDKRTLVHGAKLGSTVTVWEETVHDALRGAAVLRSMPEVDDTRIVVLGHSLGGMLIPRIAKRDGTPAGFVAMAAPTRPLEDLLLEQVRHRAGVDGEFSPAEHEALDVLQRKIARVKNSALSAETPASELPLNVPAAYWLDLRGYAPAEAAKSLRRPMLILHGGRDVNIRDIDFDGWRAALGDRADVRFRVYPALNHHFIPSTGKGTAAELRQAGHVAEEVIRDIAAWVRALEPGE